MFDVLPCEKELLLNVANGDEHAFSELFNTHHHAFGTHIYRITGSVELAEEVVQDVFLKIWMSRETFQQFKISALIYLLYQKTMP
jgi:DNA-directed RNA polymerase specialized sigma24 family protein